jgi:hypothetical protein
MLENFCCYKTVIYKLKNIKEIHSDCVHNLRNKSQVFERITQLTEIGDFYQFLAL